ncbi:class I SAM-dependent methyltransferase [Patescibacteria group bacterium]|nr:class I SAM-dependent methyltransferase [Patescibacteria group bacterium]MBU1952871.1 class I SAM-dependent methyltransferase [Patescibacteria group bacterium]
METLEEKLKRVKLVFNIDEVISRRTNLDDIKNYYRVNIIPYFLFHNKRDFVHNGISRGKRYSDKDVYEQPKIVEKYIREMGAKRCLELATGKGASSFYLAEIFPNVKFFAINLADGQLEIAKKKARRVDNFFPEEGDYHDLGNYHDNDFDIVFVFEALCHSNDKGKVAKQVYRLLKQGGLFIVIDGYLNKPLGELSETELLAKKLSERGIVVEKFELYDDVKKDIVTKGFQVIYEKNASLLVLPSLYRFEKLSHEVLFRIPLFGKMIVKLLPRDFVNNALSGYLMPTLIQTKVACYCITVFEKV